MDTKFKHNKVTMSLKRKNVMLAAMYHAKALRIHETEWTIRVNFIEDFTKHSGLMASCGIYGSKTLAINLDSGLNTQLIQLAIAHEMVHAKQWIKGELTVTKNNNFRWNGRKPSAKLAYHRTPWEIEAMSSEVIMSHDFHHFLVGL